ncbi:UdgX family uracil-DNA binding protein [Oleisolibacter albus]|uniref:UdgX family uracil-DNA binding protein n=1 Tax=Oleisolibacter albus TaxID=2171757 RepID=UPI000DF2535E|nr:UdgX family uracil-DNA binding protein [Oleisolibacter albus]
MQHQIVLQPGADLDGFRQAVRRLVAAGAAPDGVTWQAGGADLFGAMVHDGERNGAPPVVLPRALADLIRQVVCHRDRERYALLYQAVWRVLRGEAALLQVQSDPLVHRLGRMAQSVGRDVHKMHAFVRFRRLEDASGERYLAWFEPEHYIVAAVADFFVERFRGMVWSILTPVGSLHWDRHRLDIGPPGRREQVPEQDAVEEGWRGYYASSFNPARVNPTAMRAEMPRKYWRNLPEAALIPDLVRSAPERVRAMVAQPPSAAAKRSPDRAVAAALSQAPDSLEALNRIIAAAEPLVPGGGRAVLGEGPLQPALALVGEQPGDEEDRQGRPFVGPAGQLLDRALAEAGIDRARIYLTNAVKHFKCEQRGKRRLHRSPTAGEVKQYRWWLDRELALVQPRLVVALGASAALALAGRPIAVTQERGEFRFSPGRPGYVTVHPAHLLRLPDETSRRDAYAAFVADLARASALAVA